MFVCSLFCFPCVFAVFISKLHLVRLISWPTCCSFASKQSCVAPLWERDLSFKDTVSYLGKISSASSLDPWCPGVQLSTAHLIQSMVQSCLPLVPDPQVHFQVPQLSVCLQSERCAPAERACPSLSHETGTFPALDFLHPFSGGEQYQHLLLGIFLTDFKVSFWVCLISYCPN